jgi:hypothetical protein
MHEVRGCTVRAAGRRADALPSDILAGGARAERAVAGAVVATAARWGLRSGVASAHTPRADVDPPPPAATPVLSAGVAGVAGFATALLGAYRPDAITPARPTADNAPPRPAYAAHVDSLAPAPPGAAGPDTVTPALPTNDNGPPRTAEPARVAGSLGRIAEPGAPLPGSPTEGGTLDAGTRAGTPGSGSGDEGGAGEQVTPDRAGRPRERVAGARRAPRRPSVVQAAGPWWHDQRAWAPEPAGVAPAAASTPAAGVSRRRTPPLATPASPMGARRPPPTAGWSLPTTTVCDTSPLAAASPSPTVTEPATSRRANAPPRPTNAGRRPIAPPRPGSTRHPSTTGRHAIAPPRPDSARRPSTTGRRAATIVLACRGWCAASASIARRCDRRVPGGDPEWRYQCTGHHDPGGRR